MGISMYQEKGYGDLLPVECKMEESRRPRAVFMACGTKGDVFPIAIVCPFLLDQFYRAERLSWVGVAPEPLQKQHLVPERDDATDINQAAAALSGAVKLALCPEIKAQASKIAKRIASEDGIGEALRLLKEKVVLSKQGEVTNHML